MAWVVRNGITVEHSRGVYTAGHSVPCSAEEAAAMPHAVEWRGEAVTMKAEAPAEAAALEAEPKAKKRGK